jgi:hypothetical protein
MATINNSDLFKELREGIKLQQLRDVIPSQLADKVVPVMEVNPKMLRRINSVKNNIATNATSATIYTTPTDKDYFLCGFTLSMIKDVTSTSTSSRVLATIDGVSTILASIVGISLTPQADSISVQFLEPVRVDKGTNITVTNSTNVANVSANGTIYGYTVDNINA